MKMIAISEEDLAKISAVVISKEFKDAPGVVSATAIIALSALGTVLFDDVKDNDKITIVKAKW